MDIEIIFILFFIVFLICLATGIIKNYKYSIVVYHGTSKDNA